MTRNLSFSMLALIALALGLAGTSAAGDSSQRSRFILSVDDDGPGAQALMHGDYDAAIDKASRAIRLEESLSAQLTLCAAYIGKYELDEACNACDRAVEFAQRQITTARNPHGHTNRDGLAKAHSNRGVLRALTGDVDGARADFDVALRQNRHLATVRHNLEEGSGRQVAENR